MFQLYKKRSFGDMISDTFSFLKSTGKHFFKNYFTVTGIFLLILLVLSYFVFNVYFQFAFSSIGTTFGNDPMESAFGDNIGMIILVFALFFIVLIFISLLNYSFPVSYFRLYEKHRQTTNFTSRDIIDEMKATSGKLIVFFFTTVAVFVGIIFVLGMIMGIFATISTVLMLLVVVPLIFIGIPFLYIWLTQTLYHQLNSDDGIIANLGKGWNGFMSNFWSILGSTVIIYVIITILGYIVTMIPYIFGIAQMFGMGTSDNPLTDEATMPFFGVMMTITTLLSILTSFITYNLLFINQGVIYYSSVEQKENRAPQSEIDLIGVEE